MAMTSAASFDRGERHPDGRCGRGRRADLGQSGVHVKQVPVARIRPEEGLGRKRDRDGHRELQYSIEQVRSTHADHGALGAGRHGDYLLIKGQGRTLACRLLASKRSPRSSSMTAIPKMRRLSNSWSRTSPG